MISLLCLSLIYFSFHYIHIAAFFLTSKNLHVIARANIGSCVEFPLGVLETFEYVSLVGCLNFECALVKCMGVSVGTDIDYVFRKSSMRDLSELMAKIDSHEKS